MKLYIDGAPADSPTNLVSPEATPVVYVLSREHAQKLDGIEAGAQVRLPFGTSASTVTEGNDSRVGRPPHVYGNLAIARRIVNSLTPATKLIAVHLGDSRSTTMSGQDQWATAGWGIPWGGMPLSFGLLNPVPSGVWSHTTYAASATPIASPIDDYVGHVCGGSVVLTAFNNNSGTGWATNRIGEGNYDATTYLAMQQQVAGRTLSCKWITRDAPDGVTNASLRFYGRTPATLPANSQYTATYSVTNKTTVHKYDWPSSWDYSAGAVVTFGILQQDSVHLPVAGENLYHHQSLVIESDIGVTHHNCSRMGAQNSSYLHPDVFADLVWEELDLIFPNTEKIIWISLGTNAGGRGPAIIASMQADMLSLIAKARTFYPNVYVVIDTAYCDSADRFPTSRAVCTVARNIAALDPNVLAVDTAAELGSYPVMVAAGYFGSTPDGVHFNDTGKLYYAQAFAGLVARAAAA